MQLFEQTTRALRVLHVARRKVLTTLIAVVAASTLSVACGGSGSDGAWKASWYAPQADYLESFPPIFKAEPEKSLVNQTIRQVVYVSAGGNQVRVKLSNRSGPSPVTFEAVSIAPRVGQDANIDAGASRPVTFNGARALTLAAGAESFSDPVDIAVPANSAVAISIYLKSAAQVRTVHNLARQRNFVAAGDVTGQAAPTWTEINDTANKLNPGGFTAWIAALDVYRNDDVKVLVAFGDSITDGYGSTLDANNRWPNILSRIAAAEPATYGVLSVVNGAISGNRWKTDWMGPKAEGRIQRDVFEVSGVTHLSIMLGINDLGYDAFFPDQIKVASDVTSALQSAVDQAKARGLKVVVGTLTPFKSFAYYSDAREARRQEVNGFIRSGLKNVDAVVDFDQLLRNPADHQVFLPMYDSGDNLHPNDAGYTVMAQAVAAALRSLR